MNLAVDDDRSRYHLHIAHQIVVGLHGLSLLRDPHLCAVSLLEVPDKVIEIGTEIGVIRQQVIEALKRTVWYDGQCWCHYGNAAILPSLSLS